MEYFKRLYNFGELVKFLKIYIVVFSMAVVIDYINLPSEIINKYGTIPFWITLAGVGVFVLVYILQNHILNSFKAKNINELDSLILLTFIFSKVYFIITLLATPPHKSYKIVILLIIILFSLALLFCRLYIIKKRINSETQNVNIYDLKDFIETDKIIKPNAYPILFAEKDVNYDLFNREIIINQLYTSIQACKNADFSFVIGLEGPWGSGKTTVVNNVISKIKENSSNDFIIINNFDLWTYNNQKSLLISLFDKVLKSTGINYSSASLNSVVNTLFETIKGSNPIGTFIGNTFLQNDLDEDIDKLKERICDCLKQNDKTIIIFIDNLDRASSANLIFLLKIINSIFDLKRVVYVLSYDKARMNELLYNNSNINEKYIEKIIQQEISITKLDRQKIHTVANDCITKLFEVYDVKKDSYKDFSYIIDYLSKKISDIREFKRILNSVAPILAVENELCKPDLFALEIIRFMNNDFYEEIYNNSKYYISLDFDTNIDLYKTTFREKEFNQEGKDYFEKVEKNYGKEMLTFVSNIFPNVKRYLNKTDLRPDHETRDEYKDISLNCGVASAKYFDLYFHFGENEYVLISKVYNNFIDMLDKQSIEGSNDDIIESIKVFFAVIPKTYHEEVINKLWLARHDFDVKLNYPVLIGLINISNKISKENNFFALSPYQRACAIMATLFSLLNEEEKLKIISYLKKDFNLFSLCSQIVYWLNSSSLYYQQQESDVAKFEALIADMYNLITTIPVDIYCDENYRIHNSWALLRTKRKILNLDKDADVDIVDYISAIMKPEYIYRVLIDTIGISSGTRGYGYSINNKSLKSYFANEDMVLGYLKKYPPTNDIERFVYKVFEKFKFGEPDELGEKVVYTDNYIDLS